MKYYDGKKIQLEDLVDLGNQWKGRVVVILDEKKFTEDYSEKDWGIYETGVFILSPQAGLLLYSDITNNNDVKLISRPSK